MDPIIKIKILEVTQSQGITHSELIQKLWNNYGELLRVHLEGGPVKSVILKHIKLPFSSFHPKGFNSELSKQRKVRSYQVETLWYEKFNPHNLKDSHSPSPKLLDSFKKDDEFFILMEDLDGAGFSKRLSHVELDEIYLVVSWLAHFHSKFMESSGEGLWEKGTYWHLDTRPHELQALEDQELKDAAHLIDQKLQNTTYLTLVHGDAKLANFCFSENSDKVAAVDFQYVGKGPGVKDLAYFIGSCVEESQCEALIPQILDYYFRELKKALEDSQIDFIILEKEWRSLFPIAWADFHRFLKGWSPGHWKINSFSETITKKAISIIYDELLSAAKHAAKESGKLIKKYWKKEFEVSSKEASSPSKSIVTEIDLLSEKTILSHLWESIQTYDLGLLTEESDDNNSRFEKEFFWAIDPLDGTLPFSEGKAGFSVSIALVGRNGRSILGVVYDPISDNIFHAQKTKGSFLNDFSIKTKQDGFEQTQFTIFADRSLKKASNFSELQQKLNINFSGGAVMNTINVLLNPKSSYFKYPKKEEGGCAIWDLAAVSLILEEGGGLLTGIQGQPLNYNDQETLYFNQTGLLACSCKKTHQDIKSLIF